MGENEWLEACLKVAEAMNEPNEERENEEQELRRLLARHGEIDLSGTKYFGFVMVKKSPVDDPLMDYEVDYVQITDSAMLVHDIINKRLVSIPRSLHVEIFFGRIEEAERK